MLELKILQLVYDDPASAADAIYDRSSCFMCIRFNKMNLNNRFSALQDEQDAMLRPYDQLKAARAKPLDTAVVAITELKEQLTTVYFLKFLTLNS